MTDTITLPTDLTFDGTPTAANFKDYLTLPDDAEVTSVSGSASSITVTWIQSSENTKAEMAPYTAAVSLNTGKLIAAGSFTGGTIANDLTVRVSGISSDSWTDLPKSSAAVNIPAPQAPEAAEVDLSITTEKLAGSAAGTSLPIYSSYLVPGEHVLFKVYAKNSGSSAADGTLTDVVPNELEIVTDKEVDHHKTDGTVNGQNVTWTISGGLESGADFTGYVVCKVRDTITGYQNLTNTVYLGTAEAYKSAARSFVAAKEPSASYTISNSVDKDFYAAGDSLTYTIIIANTGEEDITFSELEDVFSDSSSVSVTSSDLPDDRFIVNAQSRHT